MFLLVCLWFLFAMPFSVFIYFFLFVEFRRVEIVAKLVSGVSVCVFNLGLSTEALGALVCFEV